MLPLGVFDVHSKQVASEQSRFIPAGASANFQYRVPLVGGVLGQERNLNLLRHRLRLRFRSGELIVRHGPHVRIEIRLSQHRREVGALLLLRQERLDRGDDGIELAEFSRQRGILRARRALGQSGGDFLVATEDEIEIVVGGHE